MNRKPLPKTKHVLRPYQTDTVAFDMDWIQANPGKWLLNQSPTGTGKSLMMLELLRSVPNSILVTPRVEIIAGMLDKIGIRGESLAEIVEQGARYGLYTPIRLRNLLAKGELPFMPTLVLLDECHHTTADSWKDIHMYLNGTTVVGFTASPYRGTPKGTTEFRREWAEVYQCISLADALKHGYCSLPTPSMWALIDDDKIDVVNGEIKLSHATAYIGTQLDGIKDRCREFWNGHLRMWDRPTMISVPSTATAKAITDLFNKHGLPAVCVTQDTKRSERVKAFEDVVNMKRVLVQIDVVSEGVDLPIRRLIDIKPTMSPVRWIQQIGRIMRPIESLELPPEYICLCRNLERHGYLMEGTFPDSTIREAQETFEAPSKRSGSRAVGLEGVGKFAVTPIHLLNGITAFGYNLIHVEGYTRREIFVMVHPNHMEPMYAERVSTKTSEYNEATGQLPQYNWGTWCGVEAMPDLKGCHSAKCGTLTPKQKAFWDRSAEAYGLNPHKEVTNRSFQLLPLLKDLRVKL